MISCVNFLYIEKWELIGFFFVWAGQCSHDAAVGLQNLCSRFRPSSGCFNIDHHMTYRQITLRNLEHILIVYILFFQVFNRDEPDREKTVHVTVKATDNGRPQLEDVCTLKIKVTDQNDNSPVFDRAVYDVRLSQDTQVGTQIMRVSATDVDEGDNQKIVYRLDATRIPTDIEYFEYHWQTGVVKLKKKLDKPIGYVFELKAHAQDSGTPPKSTEIDVTLEVRESDNKPPEFFDGPGSELSLPEGYSDFR